MKNFMMLDLETLGMNVITQIGAVAFNKEFEIIDKFLINVDIQDQLKKGGKIDAGMLHFWFRNCKLITFLNNVIGIRNAIKELRKFYERNEVEYVWSHTFDEKVIDNVCKEYEIKRPFPYSKRLDLTTVVYLSDIKIDFDSKEGPQKTHNALDDCLFQLHYLEKAIRSLQGDLK